MRWQDHRIFAASIVGMLLIIITVAFVLTVRDSSRSPSAAVVAEKQKCIPVLIETPGVYKSICPEPPCMAKICVEE